MPWASGEKGSTEESSLTPGHRAFAVWVAARPLFQGRDAALCNPASALQFQCKKPLDCVCLVVRVLQAREAEREGGGGEAGVSQGGPVHRQFCASSN